MNIKDRVQDCDDDDPGEAVVILTPDATIADWNATDEETIADQNLSYDEDELVIIVAFQDQIEQEMDWQQKPVDELFPAVCDSGIKFYGFPESRLTVIEAAPEGGPG